MAWTTVYDAGGVTMQADLTDGGSLSISGAGSTYDTDQDKEYWDEFVFYSVPALLAWECVKQEISLPTRVDDQVSRTRALDGMQATERDNFGMQWTYHPDAGLRG